MKTVTKVTLIAFGYLLAVGVAYAVVSIYVSMTDSPERQASSGMYAFGDSLLFLAVFAFAAVPPTCAMLYFLRAVRHFWTALAVAALSIAASGVAAVFAYFAIPAMTPHSTLQMWASLSPLRILIAPMFALAFLLSGLFAPARSPRMALLLAAGVEVAVFVTVALQWLHAICAYR